MNSKQRIILILGAAAFLYVIFTSPKISIVKGTYMTPPSDKKDIAKIVDVRTALTRAFAVLGATLLVSTAFKDTYKPRRPSPPDRNPTVGDRQENQPQPVKKDVIAKIIRFLKDFF
ncbi:MAG: hypothetical protein ACXU9K_02655 [Thermodesulfobacteriota bacterium]